MIKAQSPKPAFFKRITEHLLIHPRTSRRLMFLCGGIMVTGVLMGTAMPQSQIGPLTVLAGFICFWATYSLADLDLE